MTFFAISVDRIDELFELETLVEIKLVDVNEFNLNLTITLARIAHIKQTGKFLELRLGIVFESNTELDRSVITIIHFVYASIEFSGPINW